MDRPQPSTYPITEMFTGGDTLTVKGVSEHYFPYRYKDITCTVSECKIDIKNFRHMEVEFTFSLNVEKTTIENLYEGEYWKYLRTKYVMEDNGNPKGLTTPAPLVALMLNKYLQVVSAELSIKREEVKLLIDNNADLLILPTSYPPLTDLPEKEAYVYYDKKASVFYGDILSGQEYRLKVQLESNAASFEFAPLFPYNQVIFQKINTETSSEYGIEPSAIIVHPQTSREFPEWYTYHLNKLLSHEPTRPLGRWAVPERGTMPLFGPDEFFNKVPSNKKEAIKMFEDLIVDLSKPVTLNDYASLRFGFMVMIPRDKNTDIIVRTIKRPLPTRIYEQMQSLPNYRDVLVEYDIFNLSHEKLRLRIETEIPGYADKASKSVFIHPLNNKKNQKARCVLNQCPRLQRGILETISSPARATLVCRVKNEDTKEVIFEETYNLDLLPHDQMVWELKDVRSNHLYNLRNFICAWVNPTDPEGLLDGVRSKAAEYHEDRAFGHATSTLEDIRKHVKAVYNYLAEYGMKYVSQPFTSKNTDSSQRVVLPTSCLKNKAGNCIDLSVLFASILEGVGISTLILITQDHAYIGWGDSRNAKNMFFIEATMLGYSSFEDALKRGSENFEKDFLLSGGEYIPFIMSHSKGSYIVDLREVRHSGLVFKK